MKLNPADRVDPKMAMLVPAPRPVGQRERNKLDKLRRIKDAARELFIEKGFDDTMTREIAIRAGVGLGTIFIYAANKRDLLFLSVNDELENITKNAEASVSDRASLLENLLDVFRRHYEFFGRQPALSRLVLREMVFYDSGAQAGRFQATREGLIELLGKIVALAIAQKSASPNETPQFVGWTIFCIFQVELRRWLSHDAPSSREGMAALRRALTLFIEGMNPIKNALVLSRDAESKLNKAPERKVKQSRIGFS
jgi:AcrR family transcriptional regulator